MRSGSDTSTGVTRQDPAAPVRDDTGVAAASLLAVISMVAVLAALIVFLTTGDHRVDAAQPADSGSAPTPQIDPVETAPAQQTDPTRPPTTEAQHPTHHPGASHPTRPPSHQTPAQVGDQARDAYVEVYNNSAIKGLAATTAAALQDAGWQVVGTDNWYGNIPSNTVYYPPKLKAQASQLAKDLGISRTHPAVAPMRFDRLTIILTGQL